MARLRSQVTLVQLEGLSWEGEGGSFQVIGRDINHQGDLVVVVLTPTGDHEPMTVHEVYQAVQQQIAATPEATATLDDSERWRGIPELKRAEALRRSEDLALMLTGDPKGDPVTGSARPGMLDPRFDPRLPEGERVKRLSADLKRRGESGTSPSALREQARRLREPGGARNLVDKRWGSSRTQQDLPKDVLSDIKRFIAEREQHNTVTVGSLFALYRVRHANDDLLDGVSMRAVEKQIDKDARLADTLKAAPTRRNQANRVDQTHSGWVRSAPFWGLQLDESPFNGFALDQYGEPIKSLHLVMAVDPFHSRPRAFRLIGGDTPFTASTVKGLLWDTVAGNYFGGGPDANPLGTVPILARQVVIVSIDRGPQFNAFKPLGVAAGHSTSVIIAPPASPLRKPFVESGFYPAAVLAQMLPGAKGASLAERGRCPELFPMLRVEDLVQVVGALLLLSMHQPRGDGRGNPDFPGLRLTPHQLEQQYFRTNGHIELDPDPLRALELIEVRSRRIGDDGIATDNRTYWHPALKDIRDSLGSPNRRVHVYVDPARPHAVIVRSPLGVPLVIPEKGTGAPVPVLADFLDRDQRELLQGGPLPSTELRQIRDLVAVFARDSAVQPAGGRRSPRRSAAAEKEDTQGELVSIYRDLDAQETPANEQGSPRDA